MISLIASSRAELWKVPSRCMEKSDKQYLVLPKGSSELRLMASSAFCQREKGHLVEKSENETPSQLWNVQFAAPDMEGMPERSLREMPSLYVRDIITHARDAIVFEAKQE